MPDRLRRTILRTLAFHEAWSYAPTLPELLGTLDLSGCPMTRDEALASIHSLEAEAQILTVRGRVGLSSSAERLVKELERRDRFQARKLRRARRVARALVRLGGVRFVALANTTALGAARDLGDLDFFIVVRHGSVWTTRLIAAAAAKLFGVQPRGDEIPDAVCFSYFISDDALDLSTHQLPHDDPYFRYWFLSLLPIVDDGVGADLWERNAHFRAQHSFAERWRVAPDLSVSMPRLRLPTTSLVERFARWFQEPRLPRQIRELQNRDSRVIVSDSVLKFHVEDARELFRQTYRARLKELNLDV